MKLHSPEYAVAPSGLHITARCRLRAKHNLPTPRLNLNRRARQELACEQFLRQWVLHGLLDRALDVLCEAGFDPVYGARPLKRAIQQSVENPLSKDLLAVKFLPGSTIEVEARGGEIVFGF